MLLIQNSSIYEVLTYLYITQPWGSKSFPLTYLFVDAKVERLSTVLEAVTTNITLLRFQLHKLDTEVTDLRSEFDLSEQHARAHEIVIQQLIDASPAHQHIDLDFEIDNYHPQRSHHNYNQLNHSDSSEETQVPVSDPQQGVWADIL